MELFDFVGSDEDDDGDDDDDDNDNKVFSLGSCSFTVRLAKIIEVVLTHYKQIFASSFSLNSEWKIHTHTKNERMKCAIA